METLFSQKTEFALITVFKNYSKIDDNKIFFGNSFVDFGLFSPTRESLTHTPMGEPIDFSYLVYNLPNKKNLYHFYDLKKKNDIYDKTIIKNVKKNKTFVTTKQRQIQRHFNNPFSRIVIHQLYRTIMFNETKIVMRLVSKTKTRKFNWKFFKKNVDVISITFNLETGNITTYEKLHKRKKSVIRVNSFDVIPIMVNEFFDFLEKYKPYFKNTNLQEEFNHLEYFKVLSEKLGFNTIPSDKSIFMIELCDFFVKHKKIKVPNDYVKLLIKMYPKEKSLKKNDRKLIQSILDNHNINSKIMIKIFHLYPNININVLVTLKKIFGENYEKYVASINKKHFEDLNRYPSSTHGRLIEETTSQILKNNEKQNIVRIINDCGLVGNLMNSYAINILSEIRDHVIMLKNIRKYYPNILINSRTYKSFKEEHIIFSDLYNKILRTSILYLHYDTNFISLIETPINIDGEIYYPKVLKNQNEYDDEGRFMKHCVATYIHYDNSLIISLRNKNETERVTIEYDNETGMCKQSRYFINGKPPEYFLKPLKILNERINKLKTVTGLKYIDKTYEKNIINGKEVTRE